MTIPLTGETWELKYGRGERVKIVSASASTPRLMGRVWFRRLREKSPSASPKWAYTHVFLHGYRRLAA